VVIQQEGPAYAPSVFFAIYRTFCV